MQLQRRYHAAPEERPDMACVLKMARVHLNCLLPDSANGTVQLKTSPAFVLFQQLIDIYFVERAGIHSFLLLTGRSGSLK